MRTLRAQAELLLEAPTTEEGVKGFHGTELARRRRARGLQRSKLSVTAVLRGHTARINQVGRGGSGMQGLGL